MSSTQTQSHTIYLGIDAGGTFTDFVLFANGQWTIHKVLSTPDNPANAILQGIDELGLKPKLSTGNVSITHGSTVATNAALERKGAKTAYVTNKGFADVLSIGRQARKELYNFFPEPIPVPVERALCLEVDCRRNAQGDVITPLTDQAISDLVKALASLEVESVAINFLYSFLSDEEERRVEATLKNDYFVSRSSFILPKYKEYERGIATWLNASLSPKVKQYMTSLIDKLDGAPLSVMQSSGGTISADHAANRAVNLLLSGPAGGLSAVKFMADQCQIDQVISFDMGGTSTDVALMTGEFELTDQGKINDWPIAIPMLKMETIGAGGGSIAWVDKAKMLHVGPQSAGSKPGPICYGLGGKEPTVTDANLVLGRLQAKQFLGGKMKLDEEKALASLTAMANDLNLGVHQLALGIIEIAEEHMVKALNKISIQQGHNPVEFVLCCFGGAGGMHVCSLADKLGMKKAIIPARSGVFSAFGMLTAKKQRQYSKTHICLMDHLVNSDLCLYFDELEQIGAAELQQETNGNSEIHVQRSLDMRYQGQSATINIAYHLDEEAEGLSERFAQAHEKQFGHRMPSQVELVNINCSLTLATQTLDYKQLTLTPTDSYLATTKSLSRTKVTLPFDKVEIEVIERESLTQGMILSGPAIISEQVSTTWLKPGWKAQVDTYGHLHLSKEAL